METVANFIFQRGHPDFRHIHRTFCHTTVTDTLDLLRRARPTALENITTKELENIKDRDTCKRTSTKPRHFRLTIGTEVLCLNHHMQVVSIFTDERPVVHIVDEETHFSARMFVKNKSTASIL